MRDVNDMIDHVRADQPDRLLLATNTIADRFQHLATTAWLVDNPNRRVGIMQRNIAMWAEHALRYGGVHLATGSVELHPDSLAAQASHTGAIWLYFDRPDSPPPLPDRYRGRLAADCGRYSLHFVELDDLLDKHRPRDRPHHYLAFLAATHPGHGHGSALLRHHLRVLDARQLGAYVVAGDERSRKLYEKFAFKMLHPVLELPRRDGSGAAHVMYPMWRDPQPPPPEPEDAAERSE